MVTVELGLVCINFNLLDYRYNIALVYKTGAVCHVYSYTHDMIQCQWYAIPMLMSRLVMSVPQNTPGVAYHSTSEHLVLGIGVKICQFYVFSETRIAKEYLFLNIEWVWKYLQKYFFIG